MDITKARKVFELEKEGKKIVVTLWEGDKISSCVEEAEVQRCEACEGDEALCNEYINHLEEKGYEATEVALGEEVEESLPRFLEERGIKPRQEATGRTEMDIIRDLQSEESGPESGEE